MVSPANCHQKPRAHAAWMQATWEEKQRKNETEKVLVHFTQSRCLRLPLTACISFLMLLFILICSNVSLYSLLVILVIFVCVSKSVTGFQQKSVEREASMQCACLGFVNAENVQQSCGMGWEPN